MIFIDLASTQLSNVEAELLAHPLVSGLVLFKRNYENVEQVAELIASIKKINPQLSIAIDQEGGRVQRIREGLTVIPPMRRFGELYDRSPEQALALIHECAWLVGSELHALGIDINFAPVVDIDAGVSTVIGDRAFHADPDSIVILAQTYIDAMTATGVMPVVKHFPGHGHVVLDSHLAKPQDERTLEEIWEQDMLPYRELMFPAVMMSHVVYPDVDSLPAGFSQYWIKDCLRKRLAFQGWIFSDALDMQAAHVVGDMTQRVSAALTAGCDIALVCNQGEDRQSFLTEFAKENKNPVTFIPANKKEKITLLDLQRTPRYQEVKAKMEELA